MSILAALHWILACLALDFGLPCTGFWLPSIGGLAAFHWRIGCLALHTVIAIKIVGGLITNRQIRQCFLPPKFCLYGKFYAQMKKHN